MDLLNLEKTNDPYARYKMPQVKLEYLNSRGNITLISNLDEISACIKRPSKDIYKYIQKTLSTSGIKKKLQLNGKFTVDEVQATINAYVEQYVRCNKCGKPEINDETKVCSVCGLKN